MQIKRERMEGGGLEGETLMHSLQFCCKEEQRNEVIRELGIKILTVYLVKELVKGS